MKNMSVCQGRILVTGRNSEIGRLSEIVALRVLIENGGKQHDIASKNAQPDLLGGSATPSLDRYSHSE